MTIQRGLKAVRHFFVSDWVCAGDQIRTSNLSIQCS